MVKRGHLPGVKGLSVEKINLHIQISKSDELNIQTFLISLSITTVSNVPIIPSVHNTATESLKCSRHVGKIKFTKCIICRGMDMAKEIELGLTLEGDQIRRFEEYIQNPTCTDLGIKIIRKAVLDARAGKFQRR